MGLYNCAANYPFDPAGSAMAGVGICKREADDRWYGYTCDGSSGSATYTDLVIGSTTGVIQKFRVELHGSGSPYGAKARFFINGTLKAEVATNLPPVGTPLQITEGGGSTGASSITGRIGALRLISNRWDASPAV